MFDRTDLFRKRALDAESKAFTAKTEESRRAWMIVARDWTIMADREHLKYHRATEAKLAPHEGSDDLESAIRQLAASSHAERKAIIGALHSRNRTTQFAFLRNDDDLRAH